jgi:hypothetical protein
MDRDLVGLDFHCRAKKVNAPSGAFSSGEGRRIRPS